METLFAFEKSSNRPLYEQVREYLRQQCLNERPEAALPSLRQLSESLGINHITISKALRELESEGVLKIIPGKGTFIARTETVGKAVELITVFSPYQTLMETSRHVFRGMQAALPESFTLTGSTLMIPPLPAVESYLQSLKLRRIEAVAVFGFGYLPYPDSFLETQLIHEIAGQMPVVLVGKEHSLLKLNGVYCDPVPEMRRFLEECHRNGMRRFDYLGTRDDQVHLKRRLIAFEEFLLSHGLQWQPADELETTESDESLIHRLLDKTPEVVVVSTPVWAQALVVEAQRRGLQAGEDFQILCFAGFPEEVQAIAPYINVILLEEEEVGRRVSRRLQQLLRHPGRGEGVAELVPGRLIRQRQTVPAR